MRIIIRPFHSDDAHAVLNIRETCAPFLIATSASLRWDAEDSPSQARARTLVAEIDGQIAGFADAKLSWESTRSDQGLITLMVDPRHRNLGIGATLARKAEEHLRSVGGTVARVWVLAGSERFAKKLGYDGRFVAHHQKLELSKLPPVPRRPTGVELRPFVAYQDDPRTVHAIDATVTADERGDLPSDAMPYDNWVKEHWNHPLSEHELGSMILVNGAPAGICAIISDRSSRIGSVMTGTLREYRNRGLATYAKAVVLHCAREHGYITAYTSNDHANAPMLTINAWLGYEQCGTEALYARRL